MLAYTIRNCVISQTWKFRGEADQVQYNQKFSKAIKSSGFLSLFCHLLDQLPPKLVSLITLRCLELFQLSYSDITASEEEEAPSLSFISFQGQENLSKKHPGPPPGFPSHLIGQNRLQAIPNPSLAEEMGLTMTAQTHHLGWN